MFRKFLFLLLILILSSLFVSAQENEELDPEANACNEGGSMAGKCNIDFDENGTVDDYEILWAWTCGWYIARYDAGVFAEVPSYCQSLLPSEPVNTTGSEDSGGGVLPGDCYTMDGAIYVIFDSGGDGIIYDATWTFVRSSLTDPGLPECKIAV